MYLPYKAKCLDIQFDTCELVDDLNAISKEAWVFHGFHNTGHRVLPLVSSGGTLHNENGTYNHSLIPPFLETEYLKRMPYLQHVLNSFGTRPFRARLAELPPGHVVAPHRDLHPNWYNKVRLHIPIITHPDVQLHVWSDKQQLLREEHDIYHMKAGEAWVFNIWHVHAVTNFSPVTRVHLVADFQPEGTLFELMFKDCSKQDIVETMRYPYPSEYSTDSETLAWLSGGKPDLGRRMWNVTIKTSNPQVGAYIHPERFWDRAAYDAVLA